MLIEFKVTNFRSFREAQTLSMVASSIAERTESNTFDPNLKGFGRFLRSAVVYGPNAAGKTNLLRALRFMKVAVMTSSGTAPTNKPRHEPFKLAAKSRREPTEFQATFVEGGIRYEYGFSLDAERIRTEWLVEYAHQRGRALFERRYDEKKKDYEWKFSSYLKGNRSTWSASTHQNALFLSTAVTLNSAQLLPVFKWFQHRLVVVVGNTTLNETLTIKMLSDPNTKEKILPFLKEADLGITDFELSREQMPQQAQAVMVQGAQPMFIEQAPGAAHLVKVIFTHASTEEGEQAQFNFEDESSGTQQFFRSVGAWLNVLTNGEVLLVDEIDASLHPLLTKFLVDKFHSDENPKNAQLIFNTHSTALLDQDIFRRDQIWFVEKDRAGASTLYPLTDFKPRAEEALERGYLKGRYGALPILGGRPQ